MTIVTTNVFLAISDPTRRAVLDLLATGSRKAGDIAARFRHLTQPAVSRHLKVLREAGLVSVEVHAQQRIYELKPEGLAELYEWVAKYQAMCPGRLGAREGGSIDYRSGPAQYPGTGKILTWRPPRVFEHEWNVEPRKELLKGEKSIVRWELTPDGDGTILRITHRLLTRPTAIGFTSGIHAFLDRLEDELDGVPPVDWRTRVDEVRANYPGWDARR